MYSKGDTVKLYSGRIAIVLNDGIKGEKFVEQYDGQTVSYFNSFIERAVDWRVGDTWIFVPVSTYKFSTKQEVYYSILIGDNKGWVEERRLSLAHWKDSTWSNEVQ